MPHALAAHWDLDPQLTFLNHGSYGACPRAVVEAQARWRARLEANPVQFLARTLPPALDAARATLAAFLGADAAGLVFVPNATAAVSTVLAALSLAPGDVLLTTDHVYGACSLALERTARQTGARVERVAIPFPISDPGVVIERVRSALGPRVRLLLLDHVTSPTGLVFPVADIVREAEARGVPVLVDGAHGPGMVPLALDALGASFYTGNLHKWVCAPRGAAFLHASPAWRDRLDALVTSHGAGLDPAATGRSRMWLAFDWTGTFDPTAWLSVPDAIAAVGGFLEGGWPAVMARNAALAREGQALLCEALGEPLPAPPAMLGSLASVPLRGLPQPAEALHDLLHDQWRIEVPIVPWQGGLLVRISAHLHTDLSDIARLCEVLLTLRERARLP
jgi:isopenicillin-N epimerase